MATFNLFFLFFCSFLTRIASADPNATATQTNATIPGVTGTNQIYNPVASACGPSTAKIVCIKRYGSYLPPSFSRDSNPTVGYAGTLVPDDPTWALVTTADFVVFDHQRGLELLGANPRIQHKYIPVLNVIHEAPIYVPALNKLFVTQDGPPGNLSNIVIDLNFDPPIVEAFVTDPPVYQPTGGILHDGMIYWAVQGNNVSLPDGLQQRPGVVRVDPATLKAEWLVNNFYGFWFGGLNDLNVDSFGDVWFTDSGWKHSPSLTPAIHVFKSSQHTDQQPRTQTTPTVSVSPLTPTSFS